MRSSYPSWERDLAALTARIAQNFAPLKIVLKIRNDARHLQRWLRWHERAYGPSALTIFDNGSTPPQTLSALAAAADRMPVFAYAGVCDHIHNVDRFGELYEALRASYRYFAFIDADEQLFLADGERALLDPGEIRSAIERWREDVLFCPWADAVVGQERILRIENPSDLLLWGKPILSSRRPPAGYVNHNVQYAESNPVGGFGCGGFVAHFRYLWPQRRIRANAEKLLAFGHFHAADEILATVEDAARIAAAPPGAQHYLREMGWLRAADAAPSAEASWFTGCFRYGEDGRLQFHDEATRRGFQRMTDPRSALFLELTRRWRAN